MEGPDRPSGNLNYFLHPTAYIFRTCNNSTTSLTQIRVNPNCKTLTDTMAPLKAGDKFPDGVKFEYVSFPFRMSCPLGCFIAIIASNKAS